MYFLNTDTWAIEECIGRPPPYAILSHRWEEEEVTFRDFQNGTYQDKKGFEKIKRCCQVAANDGYELVWIDTCCIDKSSSAELSEAINSMFQWYEESDVCYAYLCDVPDDDSETSDPAFHTSAWFSRGWTLQELIAPDKVVFFNSSWREIGTRITLMSCISEITHIPEQIFLKEWRRGGLREGLGTYSIASRMSWAANRVTTRLEDEAYCLLGLFDIHMPLIYGEGHKAFYRLQQEILAKSYDCSIFAWSPVPIYTPEARAYLTLGLLSPFPKFFGGCGQVTLLPHSGGSFEISRRYIRLHTAVPSHSDGVYLRRVELSGQLSDEVRVPYDRDGILLLLKCRRPEGQLGLFLQTTRRASDDNYTSSTIAAWRCFCIAGDNRGIWKTRSISAPMTVELPSFAGRWWRHPRRVNLLKKEIEAKGYIIHTTGYSALDGPQPGCTLGFIPMGPFLETMQDGTAWVIFWRPVDNPLWPSFCLQVTSQVGSLLYGVQHFRIPEELFGGSLELMLIQNMTEDMILHDSLETGTIILPLNSNVDLVVKMRDGSRSSDLKLSIEGHAE